MSKLIATGVLTSILFPIVWGILNGLERLSDYFYSDTRFAITVCVLVGINATGVLWTAIRFATLLPPKDWGSLMNIAAPLQAGLVLVAEGLVMVEAGRLENMAFIDWVSRVEAPGFLSFYAAYLVVSWRLGDVVEHPEGRSKKPDRDTSEAGRYARQGAWFQFPMIFLWLWRPFLTLPSYSEFELDLLNPSIGGILVSAGMTIVVICMLRIYFPLSKNKPRKLITTDFFALTRHPMYHGMFLVDFAIFFRGADLHSPIFWLSLVVFWILIFTAGWFQEKETLSRWGQEAEEYYARTPRFVFEWVWFHRVRKSRST